MLDRERLCICKSELNKYVVNCRIISLQEGGILHTFKEKHWPKSIFCFAPSGLQSKSISLIDIQAAFYLTGVGIIAGLLILNIEFGFYYFANKCCNKLNRDKCIHLRTVATNPEMSDAYHVHNNGGEVMLESPSNRSRENKSMKRKTSHINGIWDFLSIHFVLHIPFIKTRAFRTFAPSDKNVFLRWTIKMTW